MELPGRRKRGRPQIRFMGVMKEDTPPSSALPVILSILASFCVGIQLLVLVQLKENIFLDKWVMFLERTADVSKS